MRINPGPFEPFVYFLQTRTGFRVVATGGLTLFSVLAISIAAAHGIGYAVIGVILLAAMLAARIASGAIASAATVTILPSALAAIFIVYGLIWLWHRPILGVLFTLWLPLAFFSATPPSGASGRARQSG